MFTTCSVTKDEPFFLYHEGGKKLYGPPDGKWLPSVVTVAYERTINLEPEPSGNREPVCRVSSPETIECIEMKFWCTRSPSISTSCISFSNYLKTLVYKSKIRALFVAQATDVLATSAHTVHEEESPCDSKLVKLISSFHVNKPVFLNKIWMP